MIDHRVKAEAEAIGRAIDERVANPRDLTWAPDGEKLRALGSLVQLLETTLVIIQKNEPEPYPGAQAEVIRQSLQAVEALRRAGIPFLRK